MMSCLKRTSAAFVVAVGTFVGAHAAMAQDVQFPTRAVTIVVPFAAGGIGDVVARIISEKLTAELGQPVLVENRTGANGALGAQAVARAKADGYSILQISPAHVILPAIQKDLGYDIESDFISVVGTGSVPLALVVNGTSNIHSIEDLVKVAKETPGGITYGSGGNGSQGHLAPAYLLDQLKITGTHLPFRGNSASLQALLGNHVQFSIQTTGDIMQVAKAGEVRVLAVTSPARLPELPDVPTTTELGYKDFTPTVWYAYLVPAKTPKPIVDRLIEAFSNATKDPTVREKLEKLEFQIDVTPDEVIAKHIHNERVRWAEVVKANGIAPND